MGVAKDYKLNPRSVGGGFVYAYRMVPSPLGQPNLELVHKTVLDEIPYAISAFQGKVLIGVGKLLRLYDLGKKKMLRKSENKVSNWKFFLWSKGTKILDKRMLNLVL